MYPLRPLMYFAMNLIMVCGMFVWYSLSVSTLTVLNALLISNATVIVRAGGAIWWNLFAAVISMTSHVALLCSLIIFNDTFRMLLITLGITSTISRLYCL